MTSRGSLPSYHEIQQYESVESVCAGLGLPWKFVWELPENADLRAKRPSAHVLYPGDSLYLPAVRKQTFDCMTDRRHRFQIQVPRSRLKIRFLIDDEPRANQEYELQIDGDEPVAGVTDGDGLLDHEIACLAQWAFVTFPIVDEQEVDDTLPEEAPGEDAPEEDVPEEDVPEEDVPEEGAEVQEPRTEVFKFRLRALDPSETVSGAQGRLQALGYGIDAITGELDELTIDALTAFQEKHQLEETGELDEPTKRALAGKVKG